MLKNHSLNQKELFEYVRGFDLSGISDLSSLFFDYTFKNIEIKDLIKELYNENSLIIDARSEKEFYETSLPNAVNFPVLDSNERHNVGLIYKNYSKKAALKLAVEYAENKITELNNFLKKYSTNKDKIFVYCWRGGGRSKYLSKMMMDLGYDVSILLGGIKSYRNNVNNYFNSSKLHYKLFELSGLTGTGKTDLLNIVSRNIPAINLEDCAHHFSSLFGYIPYKIRNIQPVISQTAFENNIYAGILKIFHDFGSPQHIIIENESKKIGNFYIPGLIYKNMINAPEIKLECSYSERISRIINDYFGKEQEGFADVLSIFRHKESFFRKEMSNKWYEEALNFLSVGDSYGFTDIMLKNYYDKRYKDKGKIPVRVINTDNINDAEEELILFYRDYVSGSIV